MERDLEMQVCIITGNEQLQTRMEQVHVAFAGVGDGDVDGDCI